MRVTEISGLSIQMYKCTGEIETYLVIFGTRENKMYESAHVQWALSFDKSS